MNDHAPVQAYFGLPKPAMKGKYKCKIRKFTTPV